MDRPLASSLGFATFLICTCRRMNPRSNRCAIRVNSAFQRHFALRQRCLLWRTIFIPELSRALVRAPRHVILSHFLDACIRCI
ncbi:hypothetical protein BOVATA_025290 [Babesia ovata]|uniref:Uncharacterized protein n=1 Tax=Babesia ovata TaxID=189622 RepID=A0A2H6KDG8_9APIC|nr:uncharacterized protein BOVATA_025290 [Babesia ovata]GBE61036.1 hypothetical protein BOVATA_025290 [Babesia ovata]